MTRQDWERIAPVDATPAEREARTRLAFTVLSLAGDECEDLVEIIQAFVWGELGWRTTLQEAGARQTARQQRARFRVVPGNLAG